MTISEVSKKYGISQDTLRYYERIGVIPPVHRTGSGLRDYTEEDCGWVELAGCMRSAGLPLEALTEYVRLCQEGDSTIPDRRRLLLEQKDILSKQLKAIQETMERLEYKISCYDRAMETGVLIWD
ncbi:MAG: MerR family transcriptional regulator [Lachnospiraceae bacterium]|nr:MerR family transcriptional regulator [Lachnospiraceae bacterium]MCI9615975.1 MerR family transcriptional regulator [Dorea sp.]GFI50547.1 HTH-type transcriptional regulator AdhR [Lachnospiraceae bacterium]